MGFENEVCPLLGNRNWLLVSAMDIGLCVVTTGIWLFVSGSGDLFSVLGINDGLPVPENKLLPVLVKGNSVLVSKKNPSMLLGKKGLSAELMNEPSSVMNVVSMKGLP